MYDLPKTNFSDVRNTIVKIFSSKVFQAAFLVAVILVAVGFSVGKISVDYLKGIRGGFDTKAEDNLLEKVSDIPKETERYISDIYYEQAIINAVEKSSPAVVSIVISKDLPVYEQEFVDPFEGSQFDIPFGFKIPQYVQKGTELKQVGAGSGFIVSASGFVLTNKHVVVDKEAEYTVFTNDGRKYPAKVLALDPVQDLAVIKIESDEKFPAINFGDSSGIRVGLIVIAIGNALGKFSNTVSVGIVSGLGRTIQASNQSGDFSEILGGIIQTDAAINQGNSGGPLLNLKGEVIGVNTAVAEGAQTIGFAIPINIAKRDIKQVIETGKISYPFLGVRYVLVNDKVKEEYNLTVDYGVVVLKGENGEPAITNNSAAEKAGIKEKDIILEFNGEKITARNSMVAIIAKYSPGDNVTLKVLRDGKEIIIKAVLGERS